MDFKELADLRLFLQDLLGKRAESLVFIFEANRLLITLGVNWTVEASYSANDETAVLIATRRE